MIIKLLFFFFDKHFCINSISFSNTGKTGYEPKKTEVVIILNVFFILQMYIEIMINGNNIKLLVFKKHDLKSKKYLSWLNQSNFRFSDNRFKKYDNISLRRFYKIFDFKKLFI